MSIKVVFPVKPGDEDIKAFNDATEKFAKLVAVDEFRQRSLIKQAKSPIEILACKYIVQYRHQEIMKEIRKRDREIKKKQETKKK